MNPHDRMKRLAALRHYGTRYEVVATAPDGRKRLLGYTPHWSGHGLLTAVTRAACAELMAFVRPTTSLFLYEAEKLRLQLTPDRSPAQCGPTARGRPGRQARGRLR